MAVYKVPQDVEADDKFLGPLSFKQFIFMGIGLIFGYITFFLITKNLWIIVPFTLIPTVVAGFLAYPWSGEQPTELWLAARIHYFLKPRKRVWDQSGIKDLVNITVPKKTVTHELTDGLNQGQVASRMSALASIVDTRGWAAKNFDPSSAARQNIDEEQSDRLAEGTIETANEMEEIVANTTDVMDDKNGAIARQFDEMIQQSTSQHMKQAHEIVDTARKPSNTKNREDFWFMHQNNTPVNDPKLSKFQASPVINPGSDPSIQQDSGLPNYQSTAHAAGSNSVINDEELLDRVHKKQEQDRLQTTSLHEKTIQPLGQQKKPQTADKTPVPAAANPVILNLAKSNDLNVSTLKRQADRDLPDEEVVVSLH